MRTNHKTCAVFGAALLLGCSIVSASDFVSYEGKDAIQEGNGGEKRTVDGIDFWSNGAPPRRFKIIGYVTDSRMKTGLIGMMRMSGLESSVAKEAKKAGGDAVILTASDVETKFVSHENATNSTGTANTSGNMNLTTTGNTATGTFGANTTTVGQSTSSSYDVRVEQQHTRYAVVKYLVDDAGQASNAGFPVATNAAH